MSSSGQDTLAIVTSDENYATMKECFSNIFDDINHLLLQKMTLYIMKQSQRKHLSWNFF